MSGRRAVAGIGVASRRRPLAAAVRAESLGARIVDARRPKLLRSSTRLLGRGREPAGDDTVGAGPMAGALTSEGAAWVTRGVMPDDLVPLLGAPMLPDAEGRFPADSTAAAVARGPSQIAGAMTPGSAAASGSAPGFGPAVGFGVGTSPRAGGSRVRTGPVAARLAGGVIIERPPRDAVPAPVQRGDGHRDAGGSSPSIAGTADAEPEAPDREPDAPDCEPDAPDCEPDAPDCQPDAPDRARARAQTPGAPVVAPAGSTEPQPGARPAPRPSDGRAGTGADIDAGTAREPRGDVTSSPDLDAPEVEPQGSPRAPSPVGAGVALAGPRAQRLARVPMADLAEVQRRAASARAGEASAATTSSAPPLSAQAPPHPRMLPAASPQPRPAAALARAPLPAAADALHERDAPADDLTDARMLANLSGGALSEATPGMSSVSFLSRAAEPDAATPAPASPPAGDSTALDDDPEPLDEDALYDRMLRRLRRELLDERERRGRSIGEGRW